MSIARTIRASTASLRDQGPEARTPAGSRTSSPASCAKPGPPARSRIPTSSPSTTSAKPTAFPISPWSCSTASRSTSCCVNRADGVRGCGADRRPAGRGARYAHGLGRRPSRHQAVQHHAVRRRPDRQDPRLRHRADGRAGWRPVPSTAAAYPDRPGARHAALHEPGAGARPGARRPVRPLFARRRALRADHRPAPPSPGRASRRWRCRSPSAGPSRSQRSSRIARAACGSSSTSCSPRSRKSASPAAPTSPGRSAANMRARASPKRAAAGSPCRCASPW